MTALSWLDGLSGFRDRYDAVFCDAWGVIHNGRALFPDAAETMMRMRQALGPVIVLTNAPKPSDVIPAQLDRLGLPRAAYDAVVTSGDVTRSEIARRLPGRAFHIGWRSDDVLFAGLSLDFAEPDAADFIVCTGFFDDGPSEPADYRPLLEGPAGRGVDMICANPDIVVNWRGERMWCAGAIAREYAALGGPVVYAGKPYEPIYALATAAAETAAGKPLSRNRILALGDGAGTDIRGANEAGIDAVYIVGDGGVHDGDASHDAADRALHSAGATAIGAMERLRW